MDMLKSESAKLSEMVMCGDHPSYTKTELNMKESQGEAAKDKDRRVPQFYNRITPTASRAAVAAAEARAPRPASSEHELALAARSSPTVRAQQAHVLHSAAIDSFRWPPYLLVAWALLLVAAHTLHGLVEVLDMTLPPIRKLCEYFWTWTEASWREGVPRRQVGRSAALASVSASLWSLYGVLSGARALALWAVLPLTDDVGALEAARVTDYVQETSSRLSANVKRS